MNFDLFRQPEARKEQVRVNISEEQRALEKQHRRRPNSRATSEPRQNKFADQGLNLKEQESADENRQRQ